MSTVDTFASSLRQLLNWELCEGGLIFGGKLTLFRCLKLAFLRAKGRGKYDDGFWNVLKLLCGDFEVQWHILRQFTPWMKELEKYEEIIPEPDCKIMRTTPIYYAGASRIVLTVLIICGHNVMVAYMLSCCKAAVVNWNKFDVVMIGGRYQVKWTSMKRPVQLNKVELEPHTWRIYGMIHKEALCLFKFYVKTYLLSMNPFYWELSEKMA